MRYPVVSALEVVPFDGARERLVDSLVNDVTEGIMVLAYRDDLLVTPEMATERARNIVCGILGNYDVRAL